MANPINTTLPYALRNQLIPVFRSGNFAGPGYAGAMGLETVLQNNAVNGGKPILVSELVKTPEGLIAFMKVAIQVQPNGYLDTVTRNHDVEYTVAELRYSNKVQTQFNGKLPHELNRDEQSSPAFKQLVQERNAEYWQADQRMMTSVVAYRPTDFTDTNNRALMISGFHVKAGQGIGGDYSLPDSTVKAFMDTLKANDPSVQADALGFGQKLSSLGRATTLASAEFEALAMLPLSSQERQFFNQHLEADAYLDTSNIKPDGSFYAAGEKDYTQRLVVPQETAPGSNIFETTVRLGNQTVTMRLDKTDDKSPSVFTKEISANGAVIRRETIAAISTGNHELDQDNYGNRAYTVKQEDVENGTTQTSTLAKPDVPTVQGTADLAAKLEAVKSGNFNDVIPEIKLNPYSSEADHINGSDLQSDQYTAPPQTSATADPLYQALLDAFQNPPTHPAGPNSQYADAGSGTATDAGGAGGPPPAPEPNPYSYSYTAYLSGAGANLIPTQQTALAAQLDALNLGGEEALSFITLPGGATLIQNLDGEIVGEINQVAIGSQSYTRVHGVRINADGSAEPYTSYVAPGGHALSPAQYEQALYSQATTAIGLMNSIIGLQNWDGMGDLQRVAAVASMYNAVDKLAGGTLPGELGGVVSVLGLLNALDQGNIGGIAVSGIAVVDFFANGVASQAIGNAIGIQAGNVVPGIGLLIALDSGDPLSVASAALAFIPGWGQAAAIFLSIAGSMFESDIPMKEGQAHAQWDAQGNTQVITDQDTEGGGATATGWMNSIVAGLQAQLAATQDAAGNSYALIPNLLPAIGYQYDADGFNYGVQGHMYLRWTDENGQSQTRYYDGAGNREDGTGETLAGDFMEHAQAAIAPAWQVQTVLAHWQQGQGITLPEQQASLPQEISDGIHQTLQALTLDLPGLPAPTDALIDIDADGYLEQTQWLAANQQVLAIDADGDNLIGAGELLHLSGGAALNSLSWLDADGNKVLNASDPAFGALRLWMDIASDGNSSGETQTLTQAGITAIDFGSNPPAVVRSDGSRAGLTAQTLTGDVLGVRYTATVGGVLESKERGETVLHAVNTRLFDGQADHMHGGDADTDGADGATINVRAGDNRLSSTSANTITTRSQQTSTSLGAGDARMQAGAAGSAQTGQAAGQAAAAGAAQVRSNGMAFVPLGAASPQAEARQALEAMVRSVTPTLFDSAAGMPALAAVAAGAAAVQWPSLVSANAPSAPSAEALAPATVQASDTVNWQALEGSRVSVAAADGLQPSSGGASATGTALASGLPTAAAAAVDALNQAPAQMQWAQAAINSVAAEAPPASGSSASPSTLSGPSDTAPSLPAASSDTLIDYPEVQGEQAEAVEDTVRRFTEAWLLANDSTVNAPAWPGEPSLRITSVFAPVHGSVSLQTNAQGETELVFLPEANYHGPASFSYTVTDQYGLSSHASVSLEVAAVNDAPVTVGEAATGDEDNTLQFSAASLLANDLDVDSAVDGDVLRITRVGSAQHGQVFLAADGTVSFIPDTNYNGPAQFTYWVGDRDPAQIAANGVGEGYETPATVNLTVLAVNDLPVVLGEVMASDEDIVLDINPALLLANDSDVDTATTNAELAQVLSITAVSGAQHGSIELLADGTLRFTPERDYFGAAGFSYTVDDGNGGQVIGQVVVNLAPVNDAPDVTGETVTFNEDEIQTITQASLLANDSDVDNPHTDLRIVAVDNATHGTVALNPDGSIRFAPDADYFGAASFTYTVSDGVGGFTVGTATLDILPVNDAPRLTGESLTTDEDQIVSLGLGTLLANDHDVDNLHTELSVTAATIDPASSAAGTVQIVAGEIVFTPTLNYFGQASFNYTVSDGVGGQSQAVVNLTFNSVNDVPVVNNELLMGKRNVTYTLSQAALLANDTDVETPNGLQIVSIQNVQNGTASLAANGAVTFAPTAGYAGRGRFDYVVQDADGGQTVGTAEIDFAAINVNPITTDDSFTGFEDIAFVIQANQLLANDTDPDASGLTTLTVDAVANASNGTVILQADGSVRFNPAANFYGTASFQYRSNDGEGGQTWATAYLNVQSVNDAPVITNIWYASGEDATIYTISEQGDSTYMLDDLYRQNGGVVAYDPDGDSAALTVSIGGSPQHGHAWANVVVPVSAPYALNYQTAPNYFAPQSGAWQYFSHLGDPYSGSDPFTVTVTDAQGASASATVTPTHQGSSAGGGGGMCPIVMDLNGNGIELIRPEDSNMFADINGDGWRERIGWAADEDGVLTFDANRDGRITESAEVSFVGYKEGARTDLDGLAAFDTNGDGKLDTGDAAWSQFGVLRDANGNGRQDEGELVSLDQLGITGVGLQRQGSPRLDHGNVVFGTTDVMYADGRTGEAGDVMFAGENVPLPQAAVDALAASQTGGAAALVHPGGMDVAPAMQTSAQTQVQTPAQTPSPAIVDDPALLMEARINKMALAFNHAFNTASGDSEPLSFVDWGQVQRENDSLAMAGLLEPAGFPLGGSPGSLHKEAA